MNPANVDTVFLAGGSDDTGRSVLRLLSSRDIRVRALTRLPAKRGQLHQLGADEVVVDNLLDPDNLETAVDGADVVIRAVGSAATDVRSSDPYVDGAGPRIYSPPHARWTSRPS